jgi:tripartite-type tricarboxylate transporter receptor subunit TctC
MSTALSVAFKASCGRKIAATAGASVAAALLLAFSFSVTVAARAESYPTRPIRLIVPVAAGAATDVLARLTAAWIGAQSGQPMIVENRPGAGGNIAVETVARAEPDGYTLLFATNGTITINRALMKNPEIDPLDLTPIAPVATTANLFVINAAVPARTLKDFIALAKAQPGKLNYGSAGVGTTPHLAGATFAQLAGIDMVHVPYRGAAPATTDLVAGNVQMVAIGYATVAPFVNAGKLRVLAVAGQQRLSYLPDVPTAAEAGLPGWDMETWYGLFAPKGAPVAIVDQLNRSVENFLDDAGTKRRFKAGYYGTMIMTPAQFSARVHAEAAKWARVIGDIGIAPQ